MEVEMNHYDSFPSKSIPLKMKAIVKKDRNEGDKENL